MTEKHESDLSRREKWEIRAETIRRLKGKDRLEYLWQYYKAVPAALFAVILVACACAVMIRNSLDETLLSIVVVDAAMTGDDAAEELEKDILQIIGTGGKYDHVETVLTATSGGTEEDIAKLRVSLSTVGEADVVVCGEDVYEEYSAQGAFADPEEILGGDIDEYEEYMTDGQIDLAKCPETFLTECAGYSPAYLCVMEYSDRKDNAKELIRALTGGRMG